LKYSVIISPQAYNEIEKAYQWLLEQSPQHAPEWHAGLIEALCSLEQNPSRCPAVNAPAESRQLLYGDKRHSYRIVFSIRAQEVWISHERHSARKHQGL